MYPYLIEVRTKPLWWLRQGGAKLLILMMVSLVGVIPCRAVEGCKLASQGMTLKKEAEWAVMELAKSYVIGTIAEVEHPRKIFRVVDLLDLRVVDADGSFVRKFLVGENDVIDFCRRSLTANVVIVCMLGSIGLGLWNETPSDVVGENDFQRGLSPDIFGEHFYVDESLTGDEGTKTEFFGKEPRAISVNSSFISTSQSEINEKQPNNSDNRSKGRYLIKSFGCPDLPFPEIPLGSAVLFFVGNRFSIGGCCTVPPSLWILVGCWRSLAGFFFCGPFPTLSPSWRRHDFRPINSPQSPFRKCHR